MSKHTTDTGIDLLKPRYKVIADYPQNIHRVGDILSGASYEKYPPYKGKYPHLFKKLEWWEYRSLEEMPEYVKMVVDCRIPKGAILKANWESYTSENIIAHRGSNPDFWIDSKYFEPATETEYNNYLKSKS